jgi:S1-C subfamily serine protease
MFEMDGDDNNVVMLPKLSMLPNFLFDDGAGLQLAKLDADLASYFQASEGVLVIKVPTDKEATLALKSGDVIQKIDGDTVETPVEAMDKLRDAGDKEVKVDLIRHGKHETIKGKPPVREHSRHKRIEIHGDEEP